MHCIATILCSGVVEIQRVFMFCLEICSIGWAIHFGTVWEPGKRMHQRGFDVKTGVGEAPGL